MKQEEKELLLKDLCARLPYGVKIEYIKTKKQYRLHELSEDGDYFSLLHETEPTGVCSELGIEYEGEQIIKPYLRPMSSMTEEERLYFHRNSAKVQILVDEEKTITKSFYGYTTHLFDWLNKKGFDYRGLIPMGLALPATEDMYKEK